MATIDWNEGNPSGTSKVGDAPDFVRNIWGGLSVGLAESLEWPGSGGGSVASLGELKLGTSKTFFEAASASSNAVDETFRARAFFTSDTSRLLVYESDGTHLIGTPRLTERSNDTFSAFTQPGGIWVFQHGSYITTQATASGSNSTIVPFPIIYSSNATVSVYQIPSDESYQVCAEWPTNVTTGGFVSRISYIGPGANPVVTIYWEALGLVAQGDAT